MISGNSVCSAQFNNQKLFFKPQGFGLVRVLEPKNANYLNWTVEAKDCLRQISNRYQRATELIRRVNYIDPSETVLALSGVKIGIIPPHFGLYSKLKRITLVDCGLRSLYPEILKLRSLEYLDVSRNPGIKIPDLRHLPNLKWIKADQVGLTEIPEWMGRSKSLKMVQLFGNYITDETIGSWLPSSSCEFAITKRSFYYPICKNLTLAD
ncbi:MAG: hypothetical protein K1060chlam2_00214 [Chlamydiae bacterium]|nr:hypothetical protein [Chlamydiota bacterium]